MVSTAEVARGNLNARIEIRTGDEIEELANAFNRMTEELLSSRERIVRAEKDAAWREMARQVAHEIKNPLTPMKLSTQHCLRAYQDRAPEFGRILEKAMGTISHQIDALQRIAAEFSDFARMPSRDVRRVSVGEVVRECVELYETGPDGPIRFEVVIEDDLQSVMADRDELRRVFINLISNAIQAMEDRGEVSIRARRVRGVADDSSRAGVEVSIEDQGSGIPEEVLPRLFQPYFSTKSKGTGLGLAICRRVVHDSGGEIRLESRPDRGTVATVVLPTAAAE
jgi:nitrogen fixation/metabolism regulation signal transduction histidine kinase